MYSKNEVINVSLPTLHCTNVLVILSYYTQWCNGNWKWKYRSNEVLSTINNYIHNTTNDRYFWMFNACFSNLKLKQKNFQNYLSGCCSKKIKIWSRSFNVQVCLLGFLFPSLPARRQSLSCLRPASDRDATCTHEPNDIANETRNGKSRKTGSKCRTAAAERWAVVTHQAVIGFKTSKAGFRIH